MFEGYSNDSVPDLPESSVRNSMPLRISWLDLSNNHHFLLTMFNELKIRTIIRDEETNTVSVFYLDNREPLEIKDLPNDDS